MSPKKNINGIHLKKRKVHSVSQLSSKKGRPVEIPIHTPETDPSSQKIKRPKKTKKTFSKARKIHLHFLNKKILFVGVLLVCIFILLSRLDRTLVFITPYTEAHDIDLQVAGKRNPKTSELGFDIIAIKNSQDFVIKSTGTRQVQEKASGTIRIFNDYSTAPQRLIEETRFESVDGKIYKLPKGDGVIIPGKKGDTPGSVDVVVYADQAGEAYNIGLTDFTIPGFRELGLDTKYKSIYALSVEEFTGGGTRIEPIVTQKEEDQAIKIAQDSLALALQEQLEREKTDDFIVVSGSERIDLQKIEYKSAKKDEHTYTQSGIIYAVIVRKDELKDFLVHEVIKPETGQEIVVESLGSYDVLYSGAEIDYEQVNTLNISIQAKPIFVWQVNHDLLKQSIAGLKRDNTSIIFAEFPSIENARLEIKPFWRTKVSEESRKIKIK